MARIDSKQHGKPPFGRNREVAANHPPAAATGGLFVVLRASDKSFVSQFETHKEAAAAVEQLKSTRDENFLIRKRA